MYKNNNILAVIPARGGSKGVPHKNIHPLAGKPLLAWSIEQAKESKYIDRLILSSDSPRIMRVAKRFGCEVPFTRPAKFAGDHVLGVVPLIHAVETLFEKYDYAVLLQCTSPLRTPEDIDCAIRFCIDRKADSCISVCESKRHPFKMQKIDRRGILRPLEGNSQKGFLPRQKLPKIYQFNGAVYVIRTKTLLEKRTLLTPSTLAYLMPQERSLDIDNYADFLIAEFFLQRNGLIQRRGHEKRI